MIKISHNKFDFIKDVHEQITHAIQNKKQIIIQYAQGKQRVLWPHILYFNPDGKEILEGYQVSGYSEHPYNLPAWRQFDIKNISNIIILKKSFRTVSDIYRPSAERYKLIFQKI